MNNYRLLCNDSLVAILVVVQKTINLFLHYKKMLWYWSVLHSRTGMDVLEWKLPNCAGVALRPCHFYGGSRITFDLCFEIGSTLAHLLAVAKVQFLLDSAKQKEAIALCTDLSQCERVTIKVKYRCFGSCNYCCAVHSDCIKLC